MCVEIKEWCVSFPLLQFPKSHNVDSGWNRRPARQHHRPAARGHHRQRKWDSREFCWDLAPPGGNVSDVM